MMTMTARLAPLALAAGFFFAAAFAQSDYAAAQAAFLEKNAQKEGVVVTESGLQYRVLEPGEGPSPTTSDRVRVHYRGMLIDGTTFDSSYDRGAPTTFGVTQVIRGWTEGLQTMRVGGKRRFFIPADLAYGAQGVRNRGPGASGYLIPPGAALVFDVELLAITTD